MSQASLLNTEKRRNLENMVNNASLATDERVLAWARLNSWGYGREFACCHVRDLERDRAKVTVFPCWRKEEIPAIEEELIVAGQQQCANQLDVPVSHIRAAVSRLVKNGLLKTPWIPSRSFVTKYKLGVGFRAHLATKHVRAFCPVQENH